MIILSCKGSIYLPHTPDFGWNFFPFYILTSLGSTKEVSASLKPPAGGLCVMNACSGRAGVVPLPCSHPTIIRILFLRGLLQVKNEPLFTGIQSLDSFVGGHTSNNGASKKDLAAKSTVSFLGGADRARPNLLS
jgi:hypothetical protein